MAKRARLPVAVLGAGHVHAPGYIRYLKAHPDVDLVGIYDETAPTARHLAEEAGTSGFRSVPEALENARAVAICPEPTRQLALVQAAVSAGLPVLCEKPFGTNLAEATALLRLSEKVPMSVALPVRYHPAAVKLKVTVQSGALGASAAVWATNRNSFPGGWFADRSLAGGGCLLDHLVHVADLVRWVWGTELVSAMAEAGTRHYPGLEAEDTAAVLVRCSNGLVMSLDPSMSRPRGMPGALDLTLKVWAERGTARTDIFPPGVEWVDEHGFLHQEAVGADMDRGMLDDWVGSVIQDRPAPVPARDAFAATCLSFAAQQSAIEHRAVPVPH
jgi:myo-inositol 2-dehydrogenase / D-chiro-inositol 1-dehydrogenase